MKTWKLLLLALVPGLWGWLCNWLTAVSLNGPAFLFTLAFYIQVPAAIVFCLWLGHLCGRSERSYPACLLLTQWPSLVSFACTCGSSTLSPVRPGASCWRGWGSTPASRCFPWPAGW